MKTVIIILLGIAGLVTYKSLQKEKIPVSITEVREPLLRVVFLQDVSKSISDNGIEIVKSNLFIPYYQNAARDIELYFGYITDSSARQLIPLNLPKFNATRPIKEQGTSILDDGKKNMQYKLAWEKYQTDSIYFFNKRSERILEFCHLIDSLNNIYTRQLRPRTDISSAVLNAQRVLTYPVKQPVQNILILNSDCRDSFLTHYELKIDAIVIQVTAGKDVPNVHAKALQNLIFQSPPESITYSLNL